MLHKAMWGNVSGLEARLGVEAEGRAPARESQRGGATHQRGGPEQLVPADDYVGQVQVVQHYLRHAHEHLFALYSPVVAPHCHLEVIKPI